MTRLGPGARTVLDSLESLSSSLDLKETVDRVLVGLQSWLVFSRASLYVRERDGDGALVSRRSLVEGAGVSDADKPAGPDHPANVVFESRRATLVVDETEASRMSLPVLGGGGRTVAALIVESPEDAAYGQEELDWVMSYARAASPSIERALLYAQLASGRRLMGELEVARQVMAGLLPSEAPKLPGFDIAAVIEPAFEVGGDYYDFIPLGNERISFALADVSGKGAPAALVVAAMRATLYTLASRGLALREILHRANEFILASTGPKAKYVTLFYAVLDTVARRFLYINAGHLPPIVLRKDGSIELLRSGGFPLGFFENPRYFEQFVQLETGDLICLYTDGITESMSSADEDYGRERLVEVLRRTQGSSASDVCRKVLRDVRHFSDGAFSDDASVLVIRAT